MKKKLLNKISYIQLRGKDSTKRKRKETGEGAGFTKPSAKVRCEIGESLARGSSDILIPVVSSGDVGYECEY